MNTFNSMKYAAVLLPALALGVPMANAADEDCDCPCDTKQTTAAMGSDRDHRNSDRIVSTTQQDRASTESDKWNANKSDDDEWNTDKTVSSATAKSEYLESAPERGFHSDSLVGRDVMNRNDDETVGEITNLVLDENGQVVAAIISVGGLMGLGERDVAIAWDQIEREDDGDETKLFINLSESSLKDAPKYSNTKENQYNQ